MEQRERGNRRVIAAINMTLDGFCDHTAVIADAELHDHYSRLLEASGAALYGRKTYELMQYWQPFLSRPTGRRSEDEFAVTIDKIPKIVFSRTLKDLHWSTARLATKGLGEEVADLKRQEGGDILVGSPGLIVSLSQLHLIDEYQLCVHPVVAGSGLPLFKDLGTRLELHFLRSKTFASGAVVLYYAANHERR